MKSRAILKIIAIIGAIALFIGFSGLKLPGSKTAILQSVQSAGAAGNHYVYIPEIINGPKGSQGTPTKTPTPTRTTIASVTPSLTPTKTNTPSPTVYQQPTDTPTPIPVRTDFQFGMQLESFSAQHVNMAAAANANWVGGISIPWKDVEPTKGTRNWSVLAYQEAALQDAHAHGLTPFVVIRFTPAWAQKYSGYSCGPMTSSHFADFANFVHDVVARYSAAPYYVKYWEIWNEEDIDHRLPGIASDSAYGCWGEPASVDAYGGGTFYADMLKVVYPVMKTADPNSKVLIGGLVLDCDPRANKGCAQTGRDPVPPLFLEGILHNGGGPYFDGVSVHAYDSYDWGTGFNNLNWQSTSATTGPVLIEKAKYIKALLSSYNVTGKFMVNTETGMVGWSCDQATPAQMTVLERTKSYMIAETLASAISQGLTGNLWYSMEGSWNCTGLINPNNTTLPAYTAYQFSSGELRNSYWVRDLTSYSGVKGFEFNRTDKRIWVLWSLDGNSHSVDLGATPLAIYHVNGAKITPPTRNITVTLEPVYIEWNP